MYTVKKRIEVSAAHFLNLDYESKCKELHGHNWIITVYCKKKELNQNGMVIDFSEIKKTINDYFDHRNLNETFDFNPTAENLAKWICDMIPYCFKVDIQETENNIVTYEYDRD